MNVKKSFALTIALTVLVSALAFSSAASAARVGISLRVNAPPPPLHREVVVVRPGPGFVWVRGHWDWVGGPRGYVWIPGAWMHPPRSHAVWIEPRYEFRHHRHFFARGHWKF
ncbi:MAG: YXWGXW repeat-containing protein [Acidobacteria bacterium]|nr:YXWGXW repeat-containing protein [Acidobacteriota bacterium]